MTENQNPENITDDVEGHGLRYKGALPQETAGENADDVEGHATRAKVLLPQEPAGEDVEGHGFRGNRIESDDDGDDVEGHGITRKF